MTLQCFLCNNTSNFIYFKIRKIHFHACIQPFKFTVKSDSVPSLNTFKFSENHVAAWSWQWFGLLTNLFPKDWVMGKAYPIAHVYH